MTRRYPDFNAIKEATDEMNSNRAVEDLELRISAQSRNLETLKKVVEDLYAQIEVMKDNMFHHQRSTMLTALDVDQMKLVSSQPVTITTTKNKKTK